MAKKKEELDGVWRTVGGRRIFIRNGQDLSSAMKESGKFNNSIKKSMQKVAKQYEQDKKEGKVAERLKENEENEKKIRNEAVDKNEYELYKRAKENPDSIDPMTENSTDWEALDKKYSSRYDRENNPIQSMANDRIKEKENTLNNDKILLDGMKKRGMKEIDGTTQEDLERRIKKNEDYLKVSKGMTEYERNNFNNENDLKRYQNTKKDILEYYTEDYGYSGDKRKAFLNQMEAVNYGNDNPYQMGKRLAEGGNYLIYNGDMEEYLTNKGINPYRKGDVFETYIDYMGQYHQEMYKEFFEEYKREHKNSNLSINDFKKWFKQ